jgi:hypothetical protein
VALERVARFRRQVEVIDWSGEEDTRVLEARIGELVARNPGPFAGGEEAAGMESPAERFVALRPGGQREPLQYDPKGYFVITLDHEDEQVVLRHYLPDHTPAHEMRGRVAGPMLLGLLREGLVTQLSHAGYLGEELAKAQAALHLGLRYDQDRPLRPRETPIEVTGSAALVSPTASNAEQGSAPAPAAPAGMPRIPPALTWAELQATAPGTPVDIVMAVTELPAADLLGGLLLESDEAEPFSAFRRTGEPFRSRWTPATRIVMGGADDLQVGALVRAHGPLVEDRLVEAERIAILTHVARIIED